MFERSKHEERALCCPKCGADVELDGLQGGEPLYLCTCANGGAGCHVGFGCACTFRTTTLADLARKDDDPFRCPHGREPRSRCEECDE